MNDEEFIDYLILNGAVEVAGIDSTTGEFLYSFTEKLAEVDPEMYQRSIDMFQSIVRVLWQKGFLDMNIDAANPTVRLNPKALDEEAKSVLPVEERTALETIIQAMSQ